MKLSEMQALKKVGIEQVAFIDFETTGLDPTQEHPTEIAIRSYTLSEEAFGAYTQAQLFQENYSSLIKVPEGVQISEFITKLTGITNELLEKEGEEIYVVACEIAELIDDDTLVIAHSANFDLGYLKEHFGIKPKRFLCTKTIAFMEDPSQMTKLEVLHARHCLNEHFTQTHRAMDDVVMLDNVFTNYISRELSAVGALSYLNKIAIEPERPLIYTPPNAKLLDFSVAFDRKDKKPKGIEKK